MSSNPVDIVKAYFGTFSLMSAEKAALYLSHDFKLTGMTANPINKETWVGVMQALKTALPDLKIKLTEVWVEENVVHLTWTGVGTHRGALDLLSVNLPTIPASGKTVTFPGFQRAFTVAEGKITKEEHVSSTSLSPGLTEILNAFGSS